VLQAETLLDLADWARAAAWQPLPAGDRVAVLTNAGGAGILAVDALESNGLRLAALSEQTRALLRSATPSAASIENPVDVLAGSGPTVYGVALNALLADAAVDALVVIVGPQDWFLPTSLAEVIGEAASLHNKPVLASLMGLESAHQAVAILRQYRIPNFAFPDRAASALAALLARRRWLDAPVGRSLDLTGVEPWRCAARSALERGDVAAVVDAYGIPSPACRLARTPDEAAQMADEIGYPVALKLVSPHIAHKSDVGGVVLNLADGQLVRDAFTRIVGTARAHDAAATTDGVLVQRMLVGGQEVIVGVRRDPQFGALVLVGSGGVEVELVRDVAVGIAPLTYAMAEELLDSTRAGVRLKGWRSTPAGDRPAVLEAVVRLSQLACDFPEIVELEINPLYVLPPGQGAFAVDVRGVVE
jgi:acetyltransferase